MAGYSNVVKALKASKTSDDSIIGILKKTILQADNGFHSKRIIKQKALDLVKVLDDPKHKNIDLFAKFFELYEAFYAAPSRGFGFHPSSLSDECPRKLFYEMSEMEGTHKKSTISAELQVTFDIGTMLHTYLQFKLWKAGLLTDCEVEINTPEGIIGKGDGMLWFKEEDILLEIKSINDRGFTKLVEPMKKHQDQASLYADALGVKKILYLYINKNTSQFKDYTLAPVKKYVDEQKAKCVFVNASVKTKKAPERVCLNVISEKALSCPFADICFD